MLGVLAVGSWWWIEIRPRLQRIEGGYRAVSPMRAGTLRFQGGSAPFDQVLELPGSPIGLATRGEEMLIANRSDPWGFLRLRRRGEKVAAEKIPVLESSYGQKVGFDGVTWNGELYVATTRGDALGVRSARVFTLHDAETLQIVDVIPADADSYCLAWDGQGYWTATRKNTTDEDRPQWLTRLGRDFERKGRYPSPAAGCQGLAWDGEYLWMVDVFSDSVYIFDPAGGEPKMIERRRLPLEYLSGVAVTGNEVWFAEYGDDRLHRVAPRLIAEWRGGRGIGGRSVAASAAAGWPSGLMSAERSPALEATSGEIDTLHQQLRSDDWAIRMQAKRRLGELGLPAGYDREQDSSAERGPEDTEVLDWEAEIRGDSLYASWRLHFGEQLFSDQSSAGNEMISMPLFVRYEVSVEGGSIEKEIERVFDASPGEVTMNGVELASNLGPGTYRISLFMHVQYIGSDGGVKILNHSGPSLEVQR
ncbi:MAG TPA: hypothetical protein VM557_13500 [Thermoanaerobaculia bacterium]|nr:hypothetical protein [Thermoanaerobaculia bacterium]